MVGAWAKSDVDPATCLDEDATEFSVLGDDVPEANHLLTESVDRALLGADPGAAR